MALMVQQTTRYVSMATAAMPYELCVPESGIWIITST